MPPPDAVLTALRAAGTPFEVIEVDPALADTADFCRHYGYPPEDSANTIVVRTKSGERRYAACVLLATCRLDVNRTVRKRLAARKVSFAPEDETTELTGMLSGGVTPVGLPGDWPVWVDPRVVARERIILGGGNRSCKIIVGPGYFDTLGSMELVEGRANPLTGTT